MAADVDVRENPRFEQGWFVVSVVILAAMALVVLAALTGILGSGPLARGERLFPGGGIDTHFERVVRIQTPTRLDLQITRPLAEPVARVHLDGAFLRARDIKDVLPRPDATRVDADGITLLFALGPERRGLVKLWLTPTAPGDAGGTVSVNGIAAPLHQFVFP